MHPNKEAALARQARIKEIRERQLDRVNKATNENDIRVIHDQDHGMTYAYLIPVRPDGKPRRGMVFLSTAVKHPKDSYSKRAGRVEATDRLIAGQGIYLRFDPEIYTPAEFIRCCFFGV